ncbi:porin [Cupriavidus plantarum]|uniref:porin n=1 Tax=Cupriavidus plantarum TaxID=942865 RepID=UPI001B24DAEF|nr:porin [Cupriavidus plantarum]CAG2133735.1 Outer membrane porin protein [Cupriavidus plantarum]SMR84264.1 Outer membrane protein (porin) [Cupriavidus plantarum]
MKARKLRIAAVIAGLFTGAVHAQSSVTLYGVVDAGVEFVNHLGAGDNTSVRMQSGNLSGSRWGLRGSEDLGGGLSAVFALESGFNIDDGRSGQNRLFGRQAWVGLRSAYGLVTLGRHNTPMYEYGVQYDPMAISTRYSIGVQDPTFQSRADNAIRYEGKFGPITGKLFYSTGVDGTSGVNGEVPGNYKVGREYSGSLAYESGPLAIAAIYDEVNGSTVATADNKTRKAAIAANYKIGPVRPYLGYRYGRIMTPPTSQTTNLYWAGALWEVTPALSLTGAAYYQDFRKTGADPWLFILSADYAFSKRTDAYLTVAYTRNKDGSDLGTGGFGTTLAGKNQTGVLAGIRHKF